MQPRPAPAPRAPAAAAALAALALTAGLAAIAAGAAAEPWFEEGAAEAGITFEHAGWVLPAYPEFFPEIMGSGACWLDYDNDGRLDLYLANSRYVDEARQAAREPTGHLYENDGDGTFTDVTAAAGIGHAGSWTMGCSSADYDGDGWTDLFLAAWGRDALYRNRGDRTFEEVTVAANVSDDGLCGAFACWGHSSAWADYDDDGDLDLYVGNYVNWSKAIHVGNGPRVYDGQRNILWRNLGDGSFEDASEAANATDSPSRTHSKTLGVVWYDHDQDGCMDIYVASDQTNASLLRNDCAGRFTDIGFEAHVSDNYSGMGTAAGDADADGWPDLYKTHYEGEHNSFYVNDRNGTYTPRSGEGDLAHDLAYVGWGTGFFDFDHDGHLDLYVANGHTEIADDFFGLTIVPEQQNLLWLNRGNGTFRDVTNSSGPAWRLEAVSRGSAVADHDLDGDLDVVFVNNANGTAHLYRNGNVTGNWLQLELRDEGQAWQAAGARLDATLPGGTKLHRHVMLGSGYLSQDMAALHLGLGNATSLDVTVTWPDGTAETFAGLAANQSLRLHRGGAVAADTLAPIVALALDGPEGLAGWYTGPVTATLEASDGGAAATGVASREVRVDGGAWVAYGEPLVFGEGERRLDARAADGAGNRAAERQRWIRVDGTAPVTGAAVEGLAGEDGWYAGPTSVALRSSDAGSGVARVEASLDGAAWVVVDGEVEVPDGEHVLRYRAVDVAGNVEAAQEIALKVDATRPSTALALDGPEGLGGWHLGPVEASLAAADATSGVAETRWRVDGGAWDSYVGPRTFGEGEATLEWQSRDGAGLWEDVQRRVLRVDAQPPATEASVEGAAGAAGWLASPATVALAASDDRSGVAATEWRLGGGAWQAYAGPFALGDGDHRLEARSRDAAGNVEAAVALAVRVDATPPSTRLLGGGRDGQWFVRTVEMALEAGDATSGVAATRYRLDGGPWADYLAPVPLGDGVHDVAFRSVDHAGNEEPVREARVQVDTAPPRTAARVEAEPGEGGWWVSPARVLLEASDDLSGVARTEAALDGGPWTAAAGLDLGDGVHAVAYRSHDVAGNAEAQRSLAVWVDTAPPTVQLREPVGGYAYVAGVQLPVRNLPRTVAVGDVRVEALAGDATSGVDRVEFRVDGVLRAVVREAPYAWTWPAGDEAAGEHTLEARAVDRAGLAASQARAVTTVPASAAGAAATAGAALASLPAPPEPLADAPRARHRGGA